MKEDHASLVNDQLCIPLTLDEKVKLVDYVTFPSFKIEIKNLKGQITQFTKTHIFTSISLSDNEKKFKKQNKKYAHVTIKNRKNISPRVVCHYCGEKRTHLK